MDERNIKGVAICVIMILGLIVAIFFIMRNDKKRVNSIDTSEAKRIIKEREDNKSNKDKKEEEEKPKKELSNFKSFELSYNGENPASSYYIKLDESRLLTSRVDEKCSEEIACTSNSENNTLQLTEYEYKLVIDLYNKLYTDEWPKETKGSFVVSVSRLANGNKEMYNNNTNGWGMYQMYDMDNDGKVIYREYGRYVLEVFNY